eukprot:2761320-Pleurochrysis_carterae.AAC.1
MVDMHSKVRHFADDTVECLQSGDILPLGKIANTKVEDRATLPVTDPDFNTRILKGETIPLFERKAWRPYGFVDNANFYGKLRYYMWTLEFPSWLAKAMESDASHFLWKSNPNINAEETGTSSRNGKCKCKQGTFRALKRGGAGQLHCLSHIKSIHASWILRDLHPRKAQWKQILDAWICIPRYALLYLTRAEQKPILRSMPEGHQIIHQALKASCDLDMKMSETYVR